MTSVRIAGSCLAAVVAWHGLRSGKTRPVVTGALHGEARRGAGVQILLAVAEASAQQGISGPAIQAARSSDRQFERDQSALSPAERSWTVCRTPLAKPGLARTVSRGRRVFPADRRVATAAGPTAAAGSADMLPGSEPRKFPMVRRRSTVRFRKGAPQNPRSGPGSRAAGRALKVI